MASANTLIQTNRRTGHIMRIALALIATAGIALAATIAGTQISTAQPETEADADRSGQIALATAQAAIATAQAAISTAQAAWAAWAITPPELTDNTNTPTNTASPTDIATNTPLPTDTPTATPSARPNKPVNIQVAVNSDGTSATVSWESGGSGVNGNCPTTRYDLTLINLTDSSVNNVLRQITAPKTTQTVTLTAGQNYIVQVSAYGSSCGGFSGSRASLDFTAITSTTFPRSHTATPTATATNTPLPTDTPTATPIPRPNRPINLQVAVKSDGTSATVSWESGGSGVNGNCPTTRYDLTLINLTDISVNNVLHQIAAPTTTQTVTLTAGQSYIVQVSTYGNSCGGFSGSRASLDFTATASTTFTPTVTNTPDPAASDTPTPTATNTSTPSVRPNKPINIQVAVNADGTGATVSWESGGSGVNGNCPTTRYDLTLINLTDSSVNNVLDHITPPTATQTLITLTAGQNYNVQVYAYGISCTGYSEFPANLSFTATASTTFPASPTATPTTTHTPEPSNTPTATSTPTITPTPTDTPSPTATNTPTITNTPSPTATVTNTPEPTAIYTATATNTPAPTPTTITPIRPRPNRATAIAAAWATESAAWKDLYSQIWPSDDYFKAQKALATAIAAVATAEALPTPENN